MAKTMAVHHNPLYISTLWKWLLPLQAGGPGFKSLSANTITPYKVYTYEGFFVLKEWTAMELL